MKLRLPEVVAWMKARLDEDPEASVDELARLASEAEMQLTKAMIARLRASLTTPLFLRTGFPPQPEESAVIPSRTRRCARCGGPNHWASECVEYLAPPPLPTEEELNMDIDDTDDPQPEPPAPPAPPAPPRLPQWHADSAPEARRRTVQGTALRRQYINELLDEKPGMDPQVIIGKVKERYGIGISWDYVYETCRVARELHHLPQLTVNAPHTRTTGSPNKLPIYEAVEEVDTPTVEEELAWLAKQAGDIMRAHAVTEIKLAITGAKARWSFSVMRSGEGETDV